MDVQSDGATDRHLDSCLRRHRPALQYNSSARQKRVFRQQRVNQGWTKGPKWLYATQVPEAEVAGGCGWWRRLTISEVVKLCHNHKKMENLLLLGINGVASGDYYFAYFCCTPSFALAISQLGEHVPQNEEVTQKHVCS